MTQALKHDPTLRFLTAEEYSRLPERSDGMKDELVRGSVVCEPQPSFGHGVAAARISYLLSRFVEEHGLGVVVGEAGFVVTRGPDTVRGPDASFVSSKRWAGHGGATFFEGAPDLAVEILSPSNTRRDMAEKTRDYLAAGARLVWTVESRKETVTVHAPGAEPILLTGDDRLDGGDVLPGFSVPVRSLFR